MDTDGGDYPSNEPVRHLFLQLRFYFRSLPVPELQSCTLQVLLFSSFFIPHFSNIYLLILSVTMSFVKLTQSPFLPCILAETMLQ